MKTVAFVPIKLNSQRLPHKNVLPVGEHALCWYIFDSLKKIKSIDSVYVFCSDEQIMDYIPESITFLKRDYRLDGDDVKGADIYKEFIELIDADVYILAHATSPFISYKTIESALTKVVKDGYDSAFSAERIQTFAWYKGNPINYQLTDVPRTQELEPVWVETSGFFIFRKEVFTEKGRRIGDSPYICEVKGREAIDIDNKEDYEIACKFAEMEGR